MKNVFRRRLSSLLPLILSMLFVCLTFLQSNAQSFCHTTGGANAIGPLPPGFASINTDGPYYIRIYVHAVGQDDGTGAPTNTEVESHLSLMRAAFAPHEIYFVQDCGTIIDNNTSIYYSDLCSPPSSALHLDGIDIFIRGDTSYEYGRATSIPGKSLGVGGASTYFGVPYPWSQTYALAHEMGHCLGLWHTFHGEETNGTNCDGTISDPNVCLEFVNGSNGSTCGDYVPDTPADPLFGGGSCTYTGNDLDPNGEPYSPDPNLIMSYAPLFCYQYHSEGQGARMREIIATSPILQACLVQPDMVSPTIASGTNPTWTTNNTPNNGDFLIEGDLVIEGGASLTINPGVKVHFGEQSKVIIKPNGRLRLFGTLTGMGCSNLTWQGVQVWGGQPNQSQYMVNGVRAQGRLETRIGAVIEHARTAAQLYGPTTAFAGGQISSERTTFRNNINGVVFAPYSNFFPYQGPFEGQPRAYFGSFSQ